MLIAILNWQVEINIPELNPEMVRDFFNCDFKNISWF